MFRRELQRYATDSQYCQAGTLTNQASDFNVLGSCKASGRIWFLVDHPRRTVSFHHFFTVVKGTEYEHALSHGPAKAVLLTPFDLLEQRDPSEG